LSELVGSFGAAKIFSTAFETMKFLSDTSPIIGFSSFFGTPTFLGSFLSYFFAERKRLGFELYQLHYAKEQCKEILLTLVEYHGPGTLQSEGVGVGLSGSLGKTEGGRWGLQGVRS
jgi:hypothetical protein